MYIHIYMYMRITYPAMVVGHRSSHPTVAMVTSALHPSLSHPPSLLMLCHVCARPM
jgi:hypothetical protein